MNLTAKRGNTFRRFFFITDLGQPMSLAGIQSATFAVRRLLADEQPALELTLEGGGLEVVDEAQGIIGCTTVIELVPGEYRWGLEVVNAAGNTIEVPEDEIPTFTVIGEAVFA